MWKLWRIGTVFGIPLMMHGTFVLLLAFYALSGYMSGGVWSAVFNVVLGLTIFTVVVLHELGHMAAYKRYGLKAKDIILTPVGGIARGIGMAKNAKEEFVIAAAGPAVNVVLAALTYLLLVVTPWKALGEAGVVSEMMTDWFFQINVVLLLFNLIPAIPMDGGRMLRAALTPKKGFLAATKIAGRVARWLTAAMAIYAIATGSFSLLLVAGVVFAMSWMEVAQAHVADAYRRTATQTFAGFTPPGRGPAVGTTVVDQYGNPVGGAPAGGWSSAQQVQPTPDGQGWSVQSVRWSDD